LRIREKVHDAYGNGTELPALTQGMSRDQPITLDDDDDDMTGGAPPFADEDNFGGGFLLDDDENPPIPEDLEMAHHEESPDTARSKGKERAADEYEYPTPSSVSPLKPAVRRQRKSLLREASESENEGSELSSAPSGYDMDDAADLSEDDLNGEEDLHRQPTARKPARIIEVSIPSTKRRDNRNAALSPPSNDEPDEEQTTEPEPSSNNDLDSEDDYQPAKASARKSTKKAPTRGRTRSAKKKPNAGAEVVGSQDEDEDEDEDEDDDGIFTPQRKRTPRRGLRRDSTIVTSPYFA
jgi:hypothetical protein